MIEQKGSAVTERATIQVTEDGRPRGALVPALNSENVWADAVVEMLIEHAHELALGERSTLGEASETGDPVAASPS